MPRPPPRLNMFRPTISTYDSTHVILLASPVRWPTLYIPTAIGAAPGARLPADSLSRLRSVSPPLGQQPCNDLSVSILPLGDARAAAA